MVAFMSYYDLPDDGYLPCELAAVEYSLNGGILRKLHFFLPPGLMLKANNIVFLSAFIIHIKINLNISGQEYFVML